MFVPSLLCSALTVACCAGLTLGQPTTDPSPPKDRKPGIPRQIEQPRKSPAPAPDKNDPGILKVGDKAPRLTVDSWIRGRPVNSFDKGRVYVVEFWATWCTPCIASIPHLTEIQKAYKDSVVVIGVAASEHLPQQGRPDERQKNLKAFVDKQGDRMDYRVAYDSKRAMSAAWMQPAGQNGIPCSFIVGHDGNIAYIGHPARMDDALKKAVQAAGGKVPDPKPKPGDTREKKPDNRRN